MSEIYLRDGSERRGGGGGGFGGKGTFYQGCWCRIKELTSQN